MSHVLFGVEAIGGNVAWVIDSRPHTFVDIFSRSTTTHWCPHDLWIWRDRYIIRSCHISNCLVDILDHVFNLVYVGTDSDFRQWSTEYNTWYISNGKHLSRRTLTILCVNAFVFDFHECQSRARIVSSPKNASKSWMKLRVGPMSKSVNYY